VLLSGDYRPLIPYFNDMKVDQLVLEFATERAGGLGVLAELTGIRELGLGVVNPRSDEIEEPGTITARVEEALKYFPPDRLFLNPDCGFGTFAERPVNTPERAYAKLCSMVKAARLLRARYA
jgi:5-methyltetrahydropteroyltriglutamate--homocysteine methyltransferase